MTALAYTLRRYSTDTLATMREQRSAIAGQRITKSLKATNKPSTKPRANSTGSEPLPVARMGEFHEAWAALRNTRNKLSPLQESDLRTALEKHLTGRIPGDVWRKMLNEIEAKLREREPLAGTSIGRRRPAYEPEPPQGW